jgi:hypothetical protein
MRHLCVTGLVLCGLASGVQAHHAGHMLAIPSPKCGWIEGEGLRDRRHLADFCAQSMPAEFRIAGASALREQLWIEAPADLVSGLRGDARPVAALLRAWLERWRRTTGYDSASVSLVRGHVELARIQTTMKGDVVMVR